MSCRKWIVCSSCGHTTAMHVIGLDGSQVECTWPLCRCEASTADEVRGNACGALRTEDHGVDDPHASWTPPGESEQHVCTLPRDHVARGEWHRCGEGFSWPL